MILIYNLPKLILLILYSIYFQIKKNIEIFFADKKFKNSTDFNNFIKVNRAQWGNADNKNRKRKKIIVSDFVHQIGFLTTECIIGNYTKNILKNEYELIGLLDSYDYQGKKIFNSYSINNFIEYPKINLINRFKFLIKSIYILDRYKSVEEFLNFSIGEVNLGKPVYDHILRNTGAGSMSFISFKFYFFLSDALYSHNFFSSAFKKNEFEYLIMSENQFLPSSIVFQAALENNIKVLSRVLGPKKIGVRLYNSNYKKFEVNLKIEKKLFEKFYNSSEKDYSVKGYDLIQKLFSGEMTHYDQNSIGTFKIDKEQNIEKFYNLLGWNKNTKICTIFSHNLHDGNYNNDWRIFKDNLTWLKKTLSFIEKSDQDINWIIKEHPSEYGTKKAQTSTYKEFIKIVGVNKKNIKFFPKNFSTRILKDITNFVLTSQGSAGYEYPCFGIPSMICGDSFYRGFGITTEPKNEKEYYDKLKNLEVLIEQGASEDQIKGARILFYILNDVIKIEHPLLTEFNISRGLNKKTFLKEMSNLLNNYDSKNDYFKICLTEQLLNQSRHMINLSKL